MNELAKEIYEINEGKGFWKDGPTRNFGEAIALVHTELSEALEAHREGKTSDGKTAFEIEMANTNGDITELYNRYIKGSVQEEFADAIIRLLDMAYGFFKMDVDWHIRTKIEYNRKRPHKHGKKY